MCLEEDVQEHFKEITKKSEDSLNNNTSTKHDTEGQRMPQYNIFKIVECICVQIHSVFKIMFLFCLINFCDFRYSICDDSEIVMDYSVLVSGEK